LGQVAPQQEEIIYNHFSAKDPRSHFIVDTLQQDWDGWYRKYNKRHKRMALPFLDELKSLCSRYDWPIEVIDKRPPLESPPESVRPDLVDGVTLYPYQIRALNAALEHPIGVFFHHTGSGKTILMSALIKLFKCTTLIVSENKTIIDQIKKSLELKKVSEDVGVFYSGKTPKGQLVCVGSIQSITTPTKPKRKHKEKQESFSKRLSQYESRRKRSKMLQQMLLPDCGMLLIDECDLASSSLYAPLFKLCGARRRYGFTGSLIDSSEPVNQLVLKERLANVIDSTSRKEVEDVGRIIPVQYVMIAYGEDGDKRNKTAYDIAIKELEQSDKFHDFIASIVRAYKNDKTLILVERTELGLGLEKKIPGSVYIYGKTPSGTRWKHIKEFEEGKIKCLIGGKIIRRGLDLKGGCDNLIIPTGMKKHSEFAQQIGRAVRWNERGFAKVFDVLFLHNSFLYGHSRSRLKYLLEMGYDSRILFPSKDIKISGDEFVRSRFRVPKSR